MRVVLDSNILLVALGVKSNYRPIWTAFIEEKYHLILSDDIVYEYEELLEQRARPGIAYITMEIFADAANVIRPQVYYSWNAIVADPDDNKFVDIAVAGNADFIVTNDAHFNVLKQLPFPNIKVISATDFLTILAAL